MDTLTKKQRSGVMSLIRSENTRLERGIVKALKKQGKSFQQHASLIGKPDIVSKRKKSVIFLDSCFWHGCRWHCRMPKSQRSYWQKKIRGNKERAKIVNRALRSKGWRVTRFWEHQFDKNFDKSVQAAARLL
ncbi:MAG: very short patch repair endonuclease [Patescibacteria group bacterium]|nr:DNA mismatch endonuclease Vsr [Patescibacteria group bacterium]MDE2015044.1 very short patch repair endonuclease [Patescibacteria group bacterium]MDE2226472.1 very short patch repair endonuclease [Patescibacteria group bacterium]